MYVTLLVGRSKGKAGIQLECIPEKRDTNNLYPAKFVHIKYAQTIDPK